MSRKMLVLDIDGTLTNTKKEITPKTLSAMLAGQEAGHVVFVASGRPTPGIDAVAKTLELNRYGGYVLSFNGARITNYATGEVVYQRMVDPSLLGELYAYSLENDLGMMTYDETSIITGTRIDSYMELEAKINGIQIHRVENFTEYVDFPVNKCLLTKEAELAQKHVRILQNRYEECASIYRSEPFFIEIMAKGIDKAASLEQLRQLLHIERENIIACGDGFNDLSMIRYAGMGVAMANAQPEVKKEADYITLSNDEDGVAKVVERFILNKKEQ